MGCPAHYFFLASAGVDVLLRWKCGKLNHLEGRSMNISAEFWDHSQVVVLFFLSATTSAKESFTIGRHLNHTQIIAMHASCIVLQVLAVQEGWSLYLKKKLNRINAAN